MNDRRPRLWLAIRFDDLPLAALDMAGAAARPVVVIEQKRVVFANALAVAAGAQRGMDITTARLLSGCEVVTRDEAREQAALHQLSERLYQFSPYIERHYSETLAQHGLLLEISSCLKLFGGVKAISDYILEYLAQTAYGFELGLAHSAKAAWYLSFEGYQIEAHEIEALDREGHERRSMFVDRLNQLPIACFLDYPHAVEALSRTGFKTFGDLVVQIQGQSISSFRKRLGQEFTDLLCEIYDIDQNFLQNSLFEQPRELYWPDEWFVQELAFEYPVTNIDQLKPAFATLLQHLSEYLRQRQQQCQTIEWLIADIHHQQECMVVRSDEPQTHWQLLYDLTLIQLDNRELPFEVDTIRLSCRHSLPAQQGSQVLDFDHSRRRKASAGDFAVTLAKLKARLGDGAVYKIGYRDSRVPELTNVMVALAEKCHQALPQIHWQSLRPTWLLSRPEMIEQRQSRLYWHGYLSILVGPERMIGDWWQAPMARDYYLARRHDNLPVWIFFNLYDKHWYVHGVFA